MDMQYGRKWSLVGWGLEQWLYALQTVMAMQASGKKMRIRACLLGGGARHKER